MAEAYRGTIPTAQEPDTSRRELLRGFATGAGVGLVVAAMADAKPADVKIAERASIVSEGARNTEGETKFITAIASFIGVSLDVARARAVHPLYEDSFDRRSFLRGMGAGVAAVLIFEAGEKVGTNGVNTSITPCEPIAPTVIRK